MLGRHRMSRHKYHLVSSTAVVFTLYDGKINKNTRLTSGVITGRSGEDTRCALCWGLMPSSSTTQGANTIAIGGISQLTRAHKHHG